MQILDSRFRAPSHRQSIDTYETMTPAPPFWISSAALSLLGSRPAALAAAASCCAATLLAGWSQLDCDPALYVRHRWSKSQTARRKTTYFRGKVVWIIGASSGIGEELAYQLSSLPGGGAYECLYLSSRSVERLDAVAQQCRQRLAQSRGDSEPDSKSSYRDMEAVVQVVPLDVTDEASLQEAVRAVSARSDGFDVVFLNAGRGHLSPATETSAETTRRVVEQTALWPMLVTPMLVPHFRPGATPHLVVTSSIAAVLPVPLSSVYAASKHALHGYFGSMQAENAMNLRVDMICPGPVDTNFHLINRTEGEGSDRGGSTAAKQALKMRTSRCVELIITAVTWPSKYGRTVFLCPQPALSLLYLYPLIPSFVSQRLLRMVGSRRVAMWRQGLDLYDPESWKRRQV
jgi:dehydrogenase/reductase SDR family member 7